jgi:DmsE family decaheme c-type cytochrome
MIRYRWIWLAAFTWLLSVSLGVQSPEAAKPGKAFDWTKVNPKFAGATFVNDDATCQACHEDPMKTFAHTKHARAFAIDQGKGNCESCHGPRSAHVEDPTADLKMDPAAPATSGVCLQCHQGASRMAWKAGVHQAEGVGCISCHNTMEQKSEKGLLVKASISDTCYSCHQEVRAEANKMSHHPIREGRMDCASCHNVHGANDGLLTKPVLNDTCFTCHAEKRGPFLWEHAPVRESCATCHVPHGSNQRTLLTAKDPFLCLTCHSYGGHINLPRYNRVSNPYGSGCSNCHTSVHGSNHPSGPKLTR